MVHINLVSKKRFVIVLIAGCLLSSFYFVFYLDKSIQSVLNVTNSLGLKSVNFDEHTLMIKQFYEKRKGWKTSNLGSMLYMNETQRPFDQSKTFVILIWKHFNWLRNRHILQFGNKVHDPFEECSVNNCIVIGDDSRLDTVDAVVVHLMPSLIPVVENRNPHQRWIFLTDESPKHTFNAKHWSMSELQNTFNWSMTYRHDSDIPIPYGLTISLKMPVKSGVITNKDLVALVPGWETKRSDVIVSILISHCVEHRMAYINTLKEHVQVDVYGKCSEDKKDSCPGHFRSDCQVVSEYLFYLVFENSFCHEYMTEKLFYNAYSKGAIPVIRGPPKEDCELLLPPNSYLHIDDYATPKELAEVMIEISKNEEKLLSFHRWRNHFEVLNLHGYFQTKSYHYCRICEALNYNDKANKMYSEDDLRQFLDSKSLCKDSR